MNLLDLDRFARCLDEIRLKPGVFSPAEEAAIYAAWKEVAHKARCELLRRKLDRAIKRLPLTTRGRTPRRTPARGFASRSK